MRRTPALVLPCRSPPCLPRRSVPTLRRVTRSAGRVDARTQAAVDILAGLAAPDVQQVFRATGGLATARARRGHAADLQALAYDLLPEHFDPAVGASPFHLDAFGVLGRAAAPTDAAPPGAPAAPPRPATTTTP